MSEVPSSETPNITNLDLTHLQKGDTLSILAPNEEILELEIDEPARQMLLDKGSKRPSPVIATVSRGGVEVKTTTDTTPYVVGSKLELYSLADRDIVVDNLISGTCFAFSKPDSRREIYPNIYNNPLDRVGDGIMVSRNTIVTRNREGVPSPVNNAEIASFEPQPNVEFDRINDLVNRIKAEFRSNGGEAIRNSENNITIIQQSDSDDFAVMENGRHAFKIRKIEGSSKGEIHYLVERNLAFVTKGEGRVGRFAYVISNSPKYDKTLYVEVSNLLDTENDINQLHGFTLEILPDGSERKIARLSQEQNLALTVEVEEGTIKHRNEEITIPVADPINDIAKLSKVCEPLAEVESKPTLIATIREFLRRKP